MWNMIMAVASPWVGVGWGGGAAFYLFFAVWFFYFFPWCRISLRGAVSGKTQKADKQLFCSLYEAARSGQVQCGPGGAGGGSENPKLEISFTGGCRRSKQLLHGSGCRCGRSSLLCRGRSVRVMPTFHLFHRSCHPSSTSAVLKTPTVWLPRRQLAPYVQEMSDSRKKKDSEREGGTEPAEKQWGTGGWGGEWEGWEDTVG